MVCCFLKSWPSPTNAKPEHRKQKQILVSIESGCLIGILIYNDLSLFHIIPISLRSIFHTQQIPVYNNLKVFSVAHKQHLHQNSSSRHPFSTIPGGWEWDFWRINSINSHNFVADPRTQYQHLSNHPTKKKHCAFDGSKKQQRGTCWNLYELKKQLPFNLDPHWWFIFA